MLVQGRCCLLSRRYHSGFITHWVQTFPCTGTRKSTPVNSQYCNMLLGAWVESLWAPKKIKPGFPLETSLVLNQDHKPTIGRLMTATRKKLHWWAQKAPRYINHKTDFFFPTFSNANSQGKPLWCLKYATQIRLLLLLSVAQKKLPRLLPDHKSLKSFRKLL